MKTITSLCFIAALIFLNACSGNKTTSQDDGSAPNTTGVQNANGNIPDTSNGITLGGSLPVDSTIKDTIRK